MTDKPATAHSLRRTSPKGTPFVGVCVLCGARDLSAKDANQYCENPIGLSQEAVIIEALRGRHD